MSHLLEIIYQGRSVQGIMLLSCQNIPIFPEFPQLVPGEKNSFVVSLYQGIKKSFIEDDLKRETSSEAKDGGKRAVVGAHGLDDTR